MVIKYIKRFLEIESVDDLTTELIRLKEIVKAIEHQVDVSKTLSMLTPTSDAFWKSIYYWQSELSYVEDKIKKLEARINAKTKRS